MHILLPGESDASSPDEYPIYARSGWRIPQENPDPVHPELMRIHAQHLMQQRPRMELRSVSNHPYNCVGLIFASRRAWIEIDHIYNIFHEDGYHQILGNQVRAGDVVLYKNQDGDSTHVALIITIERIGQTSNIKVISKWGLDPEFVHFMEDVPYLLGKPAEFWTDRIEL